MWPLVNTKSEDLYKMNIIMTKANIYVYKCAKYKNEVDVRIDLENSGWNKNYADT